MEITADLVMALRDSTNLPLMKCKAALRKADGDLARAVRILQEEGATVPDGIARRDTPNGAIAMALGAGAGVLVRLGSQTDFVANGEGFRALAARIATAALAAGADSVATAKGLVLAGGAGEGSTVEQAITVLVNQSRENIALVEVVRLTGATVVGYNHAGRIAALVAGTDNAARSLRTLAMHVACAQPAPLALTRATLAPALLEERRAIFAVQPEVLAKPEAIRPRIIDGKLASYCREVVLLEQEMLLDSGKGESVAAYAKRVGVTVSGFVRLAV